LPFFREGAASWSGIIARVVCIGLAVFIAQAGELEVLHRVVRGDSVTVHLAAFRSTEHLDHPGAVDGVVLADTLLGAELYTQARRRRVVGDISVIDEIVLADGSC
jgi:hypothetical protein